MITDLRVRPSDGSSASIVIPIGRLRANSRFIVEDIEGLTPVKSSISIDPFIGGVGGAFRSSRVDSRNIVLHLGYNKYYSGVGASPIQGMRQSLYNYFLPGRSLELTFTSNDRAPVTTEAVVESFDSVLFSKDPRVQISMLAPDPYFKAVDSVTVQTTPTSSSTVLHTPYDGDAPSPVDIRIPVGTAITSVVISQIDVSTDLRMEIRRASGRLTYQQAGVFFISTHPGREKVTFRGGVDGTGPEINVLRDVRLPFALPMVRPGVQPRVSLSRGSGATTPITVTYNNRYGGL